MANSSFSLSATASQARQGVKIALGLLVLFMVGRVVLEWSVAKYKELNPPPPTPPTYGFGLLPAPVFPTQSAEKRPQTFTLDTVGKALPDYGIKANVYFMPTAQASLLAVDRAKEQASALGFILAPEKVSNSLYRWRRTDPLSSTLEIDVVNGSLNMRADWASSVDLLSQKEIPQPKQLDAELRALLRTADLLSTDIATATPTITYVRAIGSELRPAVSVSDADFVQIDIFRITPHNFPILTAEKGRAPVRILLSGSRRQGERLIGLEFNLFPVLWTSPETYPLQSADLALQALRAGGGHVSSPITKDTAVIRNVYLAYYEPTTPQNYLQPIYVFEGDDGFQALVSALDPRSFTQQQTK